MNKEEVINILKDNTTEYPSGIANIKCDIASNGQICYPDESILVILDNSPDAAVADDQIKHHHHWTTCDSIEDFNEGIVYGEQEAREHYCNYYVSDFKSVEPFTSDFQ